MADYSQHKLHHIKNSQQLIHTRAHKGTSVEMTLPALISALVPLGALDTQYTRPLSSHRRRELTERVVVLFHCLQATDGIADETGIAHEVTVLERETSCNRATQCTKRLAQGTTLQYRMGQQEAQRYTQLSSCSLMNTFLNPLPTIGNS